MSPCPASYCFCCFLYNTPTPRMRALHTLNETTPFRLHPQIYIAFMLCPLSVLNSTHNETLSSPPLPQILTSMIVSVAHRKQLYHQLLAPSHYLIIYLAFNILLCMHVVQPLLLGTYVCYIDTSNSGTSRHRSIIIITHVK